jgi:hypothetical protein
LPLLVEWLIPEFDQARATCENSLCMGRVRSCGVFRVKQMTGAVGYRGLRRGEGWPPAKACGWEAGRKGRILLANSKSLYFNILLFFSAQE